MLIAACWLFVSLAGCSAVVQDDLADLRAFTASDLDAAHASAMAHGDRTALRCRPFYSPFRIWAGAGVR